MKYIFIPIFILSSFFINNYSKNFIDLNFIPDNAEYNIIAYKDNIEDFKDFEFAQNGESLILKTTKKQAKKLKNKVKKVLGQSFCFNGDFENFKEIVSNFKFEKIKEDLFDGIVCVYGFSKVFRENEYIVLDNTKYNTQIVFNKGVITIGFPIIVGSY